MCIPNVIFLPDALTLYSEKQPKSRGHHGTMPACLNLLLIHLVRPEWNPICVLSMFVDLGQ